MRSPTGLVSDKEDLSSIRAFSTGFPLDLCADESSIGLISFPRDMGRTLSSSSKTRQSEQAPRERMNRSLKRATTESCEKVR